MSIGLNLLSVGAAYGLMVVFQDGHLEGPLGFTAYGGIGLAAAVHVRDPVRPEHRLPRVHPEPDQGLRQGGASARQAITGGITSSAGVVTSAAAIMVAVFSIFATLSLIEFKMLGVAMAAAVLDRRHHRPRRAAAGAWPCSATGLAAKRRRAPRPRGAPPPG